MQQPVIGLSRDHLDTRSQGECALKLAGRNSTMQIEPLVFARFLAVDDQLALFDTNGKIILRKFGDSQGYPQPLFAGFPDIVGSVGVDGSFRHSIEGSLEMIKAEEQRRIEQG